MLLTIVFFEKRAIQLRLGHPLPLSSLLSTAATMARGSFFVRVHTAPTGDCDSSPFSAHPMSMTVLWFTKSQATTRRPLKKNPAPPSTSFPIRPGGRMLCVHTATQRHQYTNHAPSRGLQDGCRPWSDHRLSHTCVGVRLGFTSTQTNDANSHAPFHLPYPIHHIIRQAFSARLPFPQARQ